jgi:hypothetical protein
MLTTTPCTIPFDEGRVSRYSEMYRRGVWRSRLLHDMIMDDVNEMRSHGPDEGTGDALTMLDIGCGNAFDDDAPLQRSLASAADKYIGIEPDPAIHVQDCFSEVHRNTLETAPIAVGSVSIAFAIMVLEHLLNPQPFWDKVYDVLAPGGVFWAATVDARHWFCKVSRCAGWLHMKEPYLRLIGESGEGHYRKYPVYYHSNTPMQIRRYTSRFSECRFMNLNRAHELEHFVPHWLRGFAGYLRRRAVARGGLGTLLVVRAVK